VQLLAISCKLLVKASYSGYLVLPAAKS